MDLPKIGLNRFDWRTPGHFADDVARAERLGWGWALIPASSMKIQDPYVNLAFAAQKTSEIGLGVLLDNPVVRHPAVLASSIATIERLAPGRTLLTLGAGDTAVRLVGKRPAKVASLEASLKEAREEAQSSKSSERETQKLASQVTKLEEKLKVYSSS